MIEASRIKIGKVESFNFVSESGIISDSQGNKFHFSQKARKILSYHPSKGFDWNIPKKGKFTSRKPEKDNLVVFTEKRDKVSYWGFKDEVPDDGLKIVDKGKVVKIHPDYLVPSYGIDSKTHRSYLNICLSEKAGKKEEREDTLIYGDDIIICLWREDFYQALTCFSEEIPELDFTQRDIKYYFAGSLENGCMAYFRWIYRNCAHIIIDDSFEKDFIFILGHDLDDEQKGFSVWGVKIIIKDEDNFHFQKLENHPFRYLVEIDEQGKFIIKTKTIIL